MITPVNNSPFLRTTRLFPETIPELTVELGKSYIDIAEVVNKRTIGIFPVSRPAISGESWFFTSSKQQGLRQVYSFTTTADIPLGFKISSISRFTRSYGDYISGTATFGLINATSAPIAGQISFYIDVDPTPGSKSDLIKFVVDGAAPPLDSGLLVVEWIANV
jgi:hypothetical protein